MSKDKTAAILRILLVEDNKQDRSAFHRAFRKSPISCEITECVRAEEALEQLRSGTQAFDIVVADYKLPGISGLDLFRRMREEDIRTPFVMLTGTGSEQFAVEALQVGVDDYIIKDTAQAHLRLLPVMLPEVLRRHNDRLEHKKAEEALQLSEEKLHTMIDSMGELIIVTDLQDNITEVNRATLQVLGFADREEEMVGLNCFSFVASRDRDRAVGLWAGALRGGSSQVAEVAFLDKHGNEIPVELCAAVLRRKSGNPVGLVGIGRDITERKRAEQELARLNLILRTIRNVSQLIARENNRDRLLKGICDNLIENRSYHNCWIALLDESGGLAAISEAGLGEKFLPMAEQLKRGQLTSCGQKALTQSGAVIIEDPLSYCTDCPLVEEFSGRGAITARLKHGEKVYGLLTASIPVEFTISSEERVLFEEIAGDIAYALHKIELEEEQMRAEEELRSSEERLRILFVLAPDAYYISDMKGNFIDGNKAAEEIIGYGREELIGKSFLKLKLLPSKEIPKAAALLARNVLGQSTGPDELTLTRKDGSEICLEIRTYPVKMQDKRVVLGIARDITERKRAEEVLRESEERYHTLAGAMNDGVFTLDLEGKFSYFNRRFEEVTGYHSEDLVGRHFRKVVAPEYVESTIDRFRRGISGEEIPLYEIEVLRKDGKRTPIELNVKSILDTGGRVTGRIGVARDVTERKQAEEELEVKDAAIRSSINAVGITDLEGRLTYVNPSLISMWGYDSEEEVLGRIAAEAFWESPKDVQKMVEELASKGYWLGEMIAKRKDGSTFNAQLSATMVKDVQGRNIAMMASFLDITKRKRMEAERKEMEQKAQVSSRLATIGELASGMAHEINNPLVSVVGFSQLMMEREDLPEEVRERLGLINTGGMRIASIIQRLISFARRQKLERAYTSINDSIEEVIGLRAYEMKADNIEVSTQLDPDLPWTVADAGQLQQVFLNIVINAEKEMKAAHGGGKLSIKTEAIDKTIRISFKDDGPGIAKENLDRIFDPFFTTREVGDGAGLGLSICYGIIAEHNGWIYARSKPGKGATFIVELPVITADREEKPAQPVAKEPVKAASAKILVVDDELLNLQLISRVLAGEEHEVETVDNGDDALEMIKKGGYDLILADIKMPGMSGKELYSVIQDIAPALADRVVFVTGDILGKGTRDFLSKTGAPYINKPFDNEELRRMVNRVLAS